MKRINIGRCKDLTRRRFGRLTVLEPWSKYDGAVHWLCKCRCGRLTIVKAHSLTSGKTKSCGCLGIETMQAIIEKTKRRQDATEAKIRRLR